MRSPNPVLWSYISSFLREILLKNLQLPTQSKNPILWSCISSFVGEFLLKKRQLHTQSILVIHGRSGCFLLSTHLARHLCVFSIRCNDHASKIRGLSA